MARRSRFADSVFGSSPVVFKSDFSLDESISRLSVAASRSPYEGRPFTERALGCVKQAEVTIERRRAFGRSSPFNTIFVGSFKQEGDSVVLVGKFTMIELGKVLLATWLAFFAMVSLPIAAIAVLGQHTWHFEWGSISTGGNGSGTAGFLVIIAMFLLSLFLCAVRRSEAANRPDAKWLSQFIAATLSAEIADRSLHRGDARQQSSPTRSR